MDGRLRELKVALAVRCSLRAFPTVKGGYRATLEDVALPYHRAALCSVVSVVRNSPEILSAALSAAENADSVAGLDYTAVSAGLRSSAYAGGTSESYSVEATADTITYSSARAVVLSAAAIGQAVGRDDTVSADYSDDTAAAYSIATRDAQTLESGSVESVFFERLWGEALIPDSVEDALSELRVFWGTNRDRWGFWQDWYEGFLSGEPLNWDLQERIALIHNGEWDKGSEHISYLIQELRARLELETRLNDLENEISSVSRNRHSIGGNDPPEPIEDETEIANELVFVWEPLQALRSEMTKSKPSRSVVERVVERLILALQKGVSWCASKADLTVDTMIKWAIPAAGGYLFLNPDKLEKVIEAARSWQSALQQLW